MSSLGKINEYRSEIQELSGRLKDKEVTLTMKFKGNTLIRIGHGTTAWPSTMFPLLKGADSLDVPKLLDLMQALRRKG